MAPALSGIRVAAFTHFAAGPIAAQYLGFFGADVIKVEAPQQDVNRHALRDPDGRLQGVSPYFLATNRNQRGLGVDLKKPEGLAVVRKLVGGVDVVLENYRPGVMERLGLGYDAARELNPDVIYCSLSAYDSAGPARDRPGQDLLLQALCGLASITGRGDGPPVPVGAYVVDGFTAMQGIAGIFAALRHRDRTGAGQCIRVDMMSSALYLMAQEASYVLNVDSTPERSRAGIAHVHQSAPYGIYATRDGAIVIATFGGVPTVRRLGEALGIHDDIEPHLTEHGLRFDRDVVAAAFAQAVAKLTSAEALRVVDAAGAWAAPVRTLAEALDDPAVADSGIVRELEAEYGGRYRVVVEPLKMGSAPFASGRPAPAAGQHTREILAELGLPQDEAQALFDKRAVFGGRASR